MTQTHANRLTPRQSDLIYDSGAIAVGTPIKPLTSFTNLRVVSGSQSPCNSQKGCTSGVIKRLPNLE